MQHCRYRNATCRAIALLGILGMALSASARPPLMTGVIKDSESQVITMPRLAGAWQRTVAWLAPEGQMVAPGELVVRLDPGDLIGNEETVRNEYETARLEVESELADRKLSILDAEEQELRAESRLRIAKINAGIPLEAVTELDHKNYQLELVNAQNALDRARKSLRDARQRYEELVPVNEMRVKRHENEWNRYQSALEDTQIRAEQAGVVIYGESEYSGQKVFPGTTLTPGDIIATIARKDKLHFVFWIHDADIRKLQLGTRVRVTPDALPEKSVDAEVSWISNQAMTRNDWSPGGYFEISAKPMVALPDAFLPGMTVMAEVI